MMADKATSTNGGALLVGAGRMGRAHALALRELGLQVTGICDVRQESLDALGAEFSIPPDRRFLDFPAMLAANPEPNLVVIATTADTHCALTCAAAEAGARAILCEKPMATSVSDCRRMLEACERAGTRLAINHQMRFMPQYILVKDALAEGSMGSLASMNVVAGAFGLAMNGSHYIEAFHFLTGQWPVEVSARFTGEPFNNPRGPLFFDQGGDIRFVGSGGARLTLSIGHDQGHGMTAIYAGTFGHIFVDELQGEAIITTRHVQHRDMPNTRYGMPWARETRHFAPADNVQPTARILEALLQNGNYPCGESGLHIVEALAAAYVSAEQGGAPVAVAVAFDGEAAARSHPWA